MTLEQVIDHYNIDKSSINWLPNNVSPLVQSIIIAEISCNRIVNVIPREYDEHGMIRERNETFSAYALLIYYPERDKFLTSEEDVFLKCKLIAERKKFISPVERVGHYKLVQPTFPYYNYDNDNKRDEPDIIGGVPVFFETLIKGQVSAYDRIRLERIRKWSYIKFNNDDTYISNVHDVINTDHTTFDRTSYYKGTANLLKFTMMLY